MNKGKVTTTALARMKERREPIAMVTAYDATFARLLDGAGADILLVGDSLGMVVQGHANTLAVTMDHMVYHCAAVARGRSRALLVGDMPFLSFQVSPEEALRNAGRLIAEGGAEAVKIEGGRDMATTARRLVSAGIPVMGHVGLTPQSIHQLGGFKVQGRDAEQAERLVEDARALEDAGCFAVVLELVPGPLAARVTETLSIPTIGIGAGPACDGQVLVCYDMLGMNDGFQPKFLKTYDSLGDRIRGAVSQYVGEVKAGAFPGPEHTIGGPTRDAVVHVYGGNGHA
ncbi:MAG: 3-methyl-2-oxobutanoate hydroxymethyltransferase [Myxococcales bacterium]